MALYITHLALTR